MRKVKLLILFLGVILMNCQNSQKETGESPYNQYGNAPYVISEVHPAGAIPGTEITISGSNFPEKGLEVYFGDVMVDSLASVSALSVKVKVPRVKDTGKLKLQLRTRAQEIYSNTLPFTIEPVPEDLPTVYFATHKLYRGSISDKGLLEIDELLDIGFPRGLQVDVEGDDLLYASYYGQVYRKVGEADPVLVKKFPEGLECMIVDQKKEWMYLATASTISRLSLLDTTHVQVLYTGRQFPKSLHINEATNQLIWVERDPLNIMSGSTDGREKPKVIFNEDSGLTGPTCVEIDQENQRIYVGDVSAFGNSKILEGDLRNLGALKVILTTENGIGENVIHLEYDKSKYLYVMNSKGINQDVDEDGGIVRISLTEKEPKVQVVMQPIANGVLIAL